MVQQGVRDDDARRKFWLVNRGGLLHSERADLKVAQRQYARPWTEVIPWTKTDPRRVSLSEVVREVRPTILIGLSTVAGAFDEPLVRSMAAAVERPVIFPLSNPTSKSEAVPKDLLRWTNGRAVIATGSPFGPVEYGGRSVPIAQCNNVYIFPALGLGAVASEARRITDGMILTAARALADHSPARADPSAPLLPRIQDLRALAVEIAVAVGLEAQRTGHAPVMTPEELRARVLATQWTPAYPTYEEGFR
jgi:malate dehydrogenase (oxaloacetate-decarboxylating)